MSPDFADVLASFISSQIHELYGVRLNRGETQLIQTAIQQAYASAEFRKKPVAEKVLA